MKFLTVLFSVENCISIGKKGGGVLSLLNLKLLVKLLKILFRKMEGVKVKERGKYT